MQAALLSDRGLVRVAGPEATGFLNGLLTIDVGSIVREGARFAALLTPQGKIIVDMIVIAIHDGDEIAYLLDCPRALAPALVTKLGFYKLRAKVAVEDRSDSFAVVAIWGEGTPSEADSVPLVRDPRLAALGFRAVVANATFTEAITALGVELTEEAAYEAHRIALGVPRGGVDFGYGDTFPHEADMDQFAGIDFKKGCYVGQEVVSRMQHRGTTRNRVVPVDLGGAPPAPGTPVTAGEIGVGTLGSAAQGCGLAMLRLDRIGEAAAAGRPLEAGGVGVSPVKPAWATFPWPGDSTRVAG